MIGYKYFAFTGTASLCVTYRHGGGKLRVMTEPGHPLAEIELPFCDDWNESLSVRFSANGTLPLYLEYFGKRKMDLLSLRMENVK